MKKWNQITDRFTFDEQIVLGLVLSIFISTYLTVAAIVAIIGYLIWQDRLRTIVESVDGAYYLFAFCLVSLAVSLMNENLQGVLIAFAMSALFIISLFIRTVMSQKLFEKVIDLSCAASPFSLIIIVYQLLTTTGSVEFRASSIFLNANYYATITELVVLFCMYKMIQPQQKQRKHFLMIIFLNLSGLYLSNCRTAVIALSIAILVILILNKRFEVLGITLAFDALMVFVISLMPQSLLRIDQTGTDFVSRFSIWQTAVKGILHHPFFGQGARTYEMIYAQYGGPATVHAHSLFLDPLLNFGIVGMTFLAIYYGKNLKSIFKMHTHQDDRQRLFLVIAIMLSIMIHGITDITIFSVQTGLLLSILLAAAGIYENQPKIRILTHSGDTWPGKLVHIPDVNPLAKSRPLLSRRPLEQSFTIASLSESRNRYIIKPKHK